MEALAAHLHKQLRFSEIPPLRVGASESKNLMTEAILVGARERKLRSLEALRLSELEISLASGSAAATTWNHSCSKASSATTVAPQQRLQRVGVAATASAATATASTCAISTRHAARRRRRRRWRRHACRVALPRPGRRCLGRSRRGTLVAECGSSRTGA